MTDSNRFNRECTVGVLRNNYPENRNIAYASRYGVRHAFVADRCEALRKAWHRLSGKSYSAALHCFSFPHKSTVNLVHSFNSVVLGRSPWVVTYETSLPRTLVIPRMLISLAWARLADSQCLGILALSECSRQRLLHDLEQNCIDADEQALEAIRSKVAVLHPPQDILLSIDDKFRAVDFSGALQLVLIGDDFYRKGGLEVLIALDALFCAGMDFDLHIIGRMTAGDYASRAGHEEIVFAKSLITKHRGRIQLWGSLNSESVLNVLRRSHLLCLPTWGDTYGYSVLEGQASGCAAITTNLRALVEINNDQCGWVIPVPKLPNGDGDLGTAEKRLHFRQVLIGGLKSALASAWNDRSQLRRKAAASLERIRREHDPEVHSQELMRVYSRLFQHNG